MRLWQDRWECMINSASRVHYYLFVLSSQEGKRNRQVVVRLERCATQYIQHMVVAVVEKKGQKQFDWLIWLVLLMQIYTFIHIHICLVMKQAFYRTDIQNSTYKCVDKLFVNTAATLSYGYGEVYEFKPASKDNPIIFLNGTRKRNDSTIIRGDNMIDLIQGDCLELMKDISDRWIW